MKFEELDKRKVSEVEQDLSKKFDEMDLLNKTIESEKTNKDLYRVVVNGTHVGSYSVTSNILNQVKKAVASGCSEIKITKV